ncbi:ABC transporter ATP-binding protein [Rhizobium rhizoryzae]|uniref:Multiple sugar transport system ATP-binding protein n=1 Tax=Rhizobium rhizoryzae TaxID=451876 RepID=A0A7W6LJZ5_9HYPH|nr:sn-glycerol-3-phosphate ABC transporter ATP-binding protein UgpC [Rhizobium rhizoryzae]MBB4145744.1 multiple sugar transport system ATP-binding protein [Rhizobium rhizoryzae]
MANVSLRGVEKSYGDVKIVRRMDLEIHDGEFLVLVGPSGCGKSTTLRMIAGLEDINRGELLIGDKVVNGLPAKERDIAMVFQNYALYPHMDVFQNMAFGLELRKFPKAEIKTRVEQAADILALGDLLKRKPKELSGGQRQRVALGRAIVRQPKVFLFDEPLSNLDAQLRVQMRAEISRLHAQLKTTMVYVTHDQVEAMTMGTRIVVMKGGDVQQVGAPLELYTKPANRFVAGFIGTPQMNFLDARIDAGSDGPVIIAETVRLPLSGKAAAALAASKATHCTLGVRPSDLHVLGTPGAGPIIFDATIDMVEILGAVQVVHIRVGEQTMRAELPMRVPARPGETIRLAAEAEAFHVFDATSGVAIA